MEGSGLLYYVNSILKPGVSALLNQSDVWPVVLSSFVHFCLFDHVGPAPNVESLDTLSISKLQQRAEWVWLSALFVTPTRELWKAPPPTHPQLPQAPAVQTTPSIEMSSSLLHWTSAASRTELRSVDEEGDITACNSPTPSRTATVRLMSVCEVCWLHARPSKALTSGQEMIWRDAVRLDVWWVFKSHVFLRSG